jgi:hypothetical protein
MNTQDSYSFRESAKLLLSTLIPILKDQKMQILSLKIH